MNEVLQKESNAKYSNDSIELLSAKKEGKQQHGKGKRKEQLKTILPFKTIKPANTSTFLPTSADKSLETAEIRNSVDALGSCWV